jgi:CRP/FNR family transcriptional regulator, cyclic AMP receptor protein
METLERVILDNPFFSGLRPEYADLIAGCGRTVSFEPGEFLMREGDDADEFLLLHDGSVTLETFVPHRGPLTIQTVEAGDLVGFSWLIPPHKSRFDVRALELVRATSFDGICLRGKGESDHQFGYELLSRFSVLLAERVEATQTRLLEVFGERNG